MQKKSSKSGFLVLLVIAVVIFLVYFLPAIKKDQEIKERPFITSPETLEREVEIVAVDAFGKTVNWDSDDRPDTIKNITKTEQVSGPDQGSYLIEIEYRAGDNLTTGMIKGGILMDAIKFSENLYQTPSCREINIYMLKPFLILTDKYGNKQEEQVAKLVLRRAIANEINWENITNDMFERVLREDEQLWFHPALNE